MKASLDLNKVLKLSHLQAPIQRIADKIAGYFVPGILILAFSGFSAWLVALVVMKQTGAQVLASYCILSVGIAMVFGPAHKM